ncbi:PadR family transcriptional regulator [Halobacillus rhizosphaerae]|uniref:PadR family transcriptional regulator n=1 Tax=Halobacillus rhizosphaerae TaxID=3064889 RepID=UPI00398B4F3C
MYELFILGELKDKPMHGYLLQYVLGKIIGPDRKMSWGVLYPLLQRLTKEGYITQTLQEQSGPGRPKKILKITDKGLSRFDELMEEPAEYDQNTEDLFHIKLSNFHHINEKLRLAILEQHKSYLLYLLDYVEENRSLVMDQEEIKNDEKTSINSVLTHRSKRIEADLQWLKQEMEHVKEEKYDTGEK